MIANTNPSTGIRYGVISTQSLNQDLVGDLFYGSGANNRSEECAIDDARAEFTQLRVMEGPTGLAERLCSPCVPNAADLDNDFVLEAEADEGQKEAWYFCYVIPKDWFQKEEA